MRHTASLHTHLLYLIFSVVATVVCLVTSASAQQIWIRAYETQEDLWESYQEGEITLEQYRDLLALFRAGADSVFQPLDDIEQLPGFSPLDSMPRLAPPTLLFQAKSNTRRRVAGSTEIRWGYTLPVREETEEEGYLISRWRSENVRLVLDGRAENGQLAGFRTRGLVIGRADSGVRLTLGNFEPRYGLGLIVGRRDRILGRTETTRLTGSFWQPTYSRFNGVQFQSRTVAGQVESFVSRLESEDFREDCYAAHLSVQLNSATAFGLASVMTDLSHRQAGQRARRVGVGPSLSYNGAGIESSAEIGMLDGGDYAAALKIIRRSAKTRVAMTLWSYDPEYTLPSSGGPGHPGRNRIQLFADELDYYSRTAGEQGCLLNVRAPCGLIGRVESDLQIYKDRLTGTKNLAGKLACKFAPGGGNRITAYLRGRDRKGAGLDQQQMYYGLIGRRPIFGRSKAGIRVEYGRTNSADDRLRESLRLELRAGIPLNRRLQITPRWRYVDPDLSAAGDGYYYLYITESVNPGQSITLQFIATVKGYEKSENETYADIRLRMRWRL